MRLRKLQSSGPHVVEHGGRLAERTLVLLKPDAVERRLVGELVGRIEERGLAVVGLKLTVATRSLAEAHYADHRDRDFFERACVFLCSGPLVAVGVEGRGALSAIRRLIGSSPDPLLCDVGTIRGDLASHWRRNLVHGSDSPESASRELDLWFPEGLLPAPSALSPYLYELPDSTISFSSEETS